jgi:hypothetical protein
VLTGKADDPHKHETTVHNGFLRYESTAIFQRDRFADSNAISVAR